MNSIEKRLSKLRQLLTDSSQALLITNETNVGYFSGFQHSEGMYILTKNNSYLLVDFRYTEAAQRFAKACTVVEVKLFIDDIIKILTKENIKALYLEASDMTLQRYSLYSKKFNEKSIECITDKTLDEAISNIRIVKDSQELEKIEAAQKIAEKAYLEVLNYIKVGVTERSIALELEYLMKKNGAERVSFDLITITGKKTSLPHGVPSDDVVKRGDFFTMDFGAVYDGYHSDTTRTVAIGEVTDEQKKIYDIVLKAQLATLNSIKAGALCCDVDKTARNIIDEAGFGKYFGHSTGHGVGLEIHEQPFVSTRSQTVLRPGMIITDEPGIYLPDKFGVRIEDMVAVTENGYKNLVSLPKELIIL